MSAAKNSQPAVQEDVKVTCDVSTSEYVELNLHSETNDQTIPVSAQELSKPMSKRALKRQARTQQYKELKKRRKAQNLIQTGREEAGYNLEEFDETSYYFENGLRKVYPYHYVFATHAKGRWVGRTLKSVLEKEFGFDQPEDVDKAFHNGKIHVNNVQVSVDYVVKDCDFISHQVHRHENHVTDSAIEILVDTKDVVVINKPSSIPCHPCGRYRYNSVVFILGKEMGYCNLRNIYRLDRLTSGVLVLGKTVESTKRLEDQVVKREVNKEYVCRVEGEFPSETLTVDQPLQALSNKLRLQVISPTGKPSQTTFTRLSYNGNSSVVRCVPHTGRTHQIRVHLQFLGHPIINDVFYNSNAWGPNKGKGGIYELSHDLVCSRILEKHRATQWDGGENPLFHQKLKEMEQRTTKSKCDDDDMLVTGSPVNRDGETQTTSHAIGAAEEESDSVLNEDDITISKMENKSDFTTLNKSHSSELSDSKDTVLSVAPDNNVKPDCDHHNPRKDDDDKSSSDCVEKSVKVKELCPPSAFEWAKWNVDPSCDLCKKTTLDPKPKDLVMFLHALKYKGPGWEYQTKLPDWACNDWADEEQFLLEPTTQNDA